MTNNDQDTEAVRALESKHSQVTHWTDAGKSVAILLLWNGETPVARFLFDATKLLGGEPLTSVGQVMVTADPDRFKVLLWPGVTMCTGTMGPPGEGADWDMPNGWCRAGDLMKVLLHEPKRNELTFKVNKVTCLGTAGLEWTKAP